MSNFLLVMLGGAFGAASRYGLSLALPKSTWCTTTVNILGSFLAVWFFHSFAKPSSPTHLLVITGFCGAFTTYSAFSLDTLKMLNQDEYGLFSIASFVSFNVLGSLMAAFIAWKLFSVTTT